MKARREAAFRKELKQLDDQHGRVWGKAKLEGPQPQKLTTQQNLLNAALRAIMKYASMVIDSDVVCVPD